MNMKNYETPVMQLIALASADVITLSNNGTGEGSIDKDFSDMMNA